MTDTHTAAHIPDEAVRAAIKSFESTDNNCETYQDMRKAITAALPHLSAPCADKPVDQEAKDFEAIGRSYMAAFETVTAEASEWEGYTPSECPSELLLDIYAAQQEAKPVDLAAVQSDLDDRLKAAGMYSVAELMAGTPVDKWRVHSGMDNLQFFGEWLERKAREYKVMTAGYDIGDKDKSDDLYEWVLAHSGAFHDVLVNFRAAIRALSPAEPAQGGYSASDELRDLHQSILQSKTLADFNAVKKTIEYLTAVTSEAGK